MIVTCTHRQVPTPCHLLAGDLHGEGGLRHGAPAQLSQQGADEFVFQLRLDAGGQSRGIKMLSVTNIKAAAVALASVKIA